MKTNFESNIDKNIKSNIKNNTESDINTNIDTDISIKSDKTFGVARRKIKSNKKSFPVYCNDELVKRLDSYCKKAGYNRNEIVIKMIEHCLENAQVYEEK